MTCSVLAGIIIISSMYLLCGTWSILPSYLIGAVEGSEPDLLGLNPVSITL